MSELSWQSALMQELETCFFYCNALLGPAQLTFTLEPQNDRSLPNDPSSIGATIKLFHRGVQVDADFVQVVFQDEATFKMELTEALSGFGKTISNLDDIKPR